MTIDDDLNERLIFARTLARDVGREAVRFWNESSGKALGTEQKSTQDFVTLADKQAEDTIKTALAKTFPNDGFIGEETGEETGGKTGQSGTWVVDPIDGTSNYLRGLRHWGVSIAYVLDGVTVLGVVHDSPTDRVYYARLEHGAWRDDKKISVSGTNNPEVAMGILGVSRRTEFELYLTQLRALFDAGIEHRKIGSAAIGLLRVAEGVADFYYEKHLNSWDALAGLLIAQEAGAKIIVPENDTFIAQGGEVLCSTPALSAQLEILLAGPDPRTFH